MAISVRMDTLLEKELELTAKRRGITKSQFIIEAVERALGHKDPYRLLLKVREASPSDDADVAAPPQDEALPSLATTHDRMYEKLMARHAAATADWLAARGQPPVAPPATRRPRGNR